MNLRAIALTCAAGSLVLTMSGCVTVYNTTYPVVEGVGTSRLSTATPSAATLASEAASIASEAATVAVESASAVEASAASSASTQKSTTTKTVTAAKLSALPKDVVQYAKDLGAKTATGQDVTLLVIGSAADQKGAQAVIDKTFNIQSDYEGYFVIEKADHFQGLSGTQPFVAVEAFKTQDKANKALAANKSTFATAKLVNVKVLCTDPFPVYESLTTP